MAIWKSRSGDSDSSGLFARLKAGLKATRDLFGTDIRDLFKTDGTLVDEYFLSNLIFSIINLF